MESGNTVSLVCSMGDRSVIAENIIRVAGGLEEAENALFSLHIKAQDVSRMLRGEYDWEEHSLAQVAAVLGCDLSALKDVVLPTDDSEAWERLVALYDRPLSKARLEDAAEKFEKVFTRIKNRASSL